MKKEKAKHRIEELNSVLQKHNYQYYVLSEPIISDYNFDKLLDELFVLEKKFPEYILPDSPTKRVGGEITKEFIQFSHKYPMLSLDNTYSEQEIIDFDNRVKKIIDTEAEYICELKYDGVAISLNYQNGLLVRALTRGNGINGDDITANIKTIKSIPIRLKGTDFPSDFYIRGEVFMPLDSFEAFNKKREEQGEEKFANPRNTTSGSLKMLDSAKVAKRPLDCYLYSLHSNILPFNNHYDNLIKAKEWGFKIPDFIAKCQNLEEVFSFLNFWDAKKNELNFYIDGVVIKVNDYEQQNILSHTAKSPRWAIAYKFKTERAETQLLSITYQVGRIGTITPVANLAPILISGTTVKRASLHNADFIKNMDIREGDFVFVEKGGEIIPKIVGVNFGKRSKNIHKNIFIEHCPECETELIRKEGGANHFCPNSKNCPPQIKGRLEHFISRNAMDIDSLGEGKIELLFDKGFIKNQADIYFLKSSQMLGLEKIIISDEGKQKKTSFREKTVENILKGIEQSKKMSFDRILFGLGIRHVGRTISKKITKNFKNIENLMRASFEDLIAVDEIGDKIARSIIDFFSVLENKIMIERLENAGLHLEIDILEGTNDKLQNKTFVITGSFTDLKRDDIKEMIEINGGKCTTSVSTKTDYLVAGKSPGQSKIKASEKHKTKVIDFEGFEKLLL